MRIKIKIHSFLPAVAGLIGATLLFCLPGDNLPDVGWLDKIHFDKIVHIGLFSTLVTLWCLPFKARLEDSVVLNRRYGWITGAFVLYGIAIEFIQRDYIPYRSFDGFDIVADIVGCIVGLIAVKRIFS